MRKLTEQEMRTVSGGGYQEALRKLADALRRNQLDAKGPRR